jgi:hypothetical protein
MSYLCVVRGGVHGGVHLVSCVFEGVKEDMLATSRFRQSVLRHSHLRNLKLETPSTSLVPSSFFDCLAIPGLSHYLLRGSLSFPATIVLHDCETYMGHGHS